MEVAIISALVRDIILKDSRYHGTVKRRRVDSHSQSGVRNASNGRYFGNEVKKMQHVMKKRSCRRCDGKTRSHVGDGKHKGCGSRKSKKLIKEEP